MYLKLVYASNIALFFFTTVVKLWAQKPVGISGIEKECGKEGRVIIDERGLVEGNE
jgi:hypothetical protein